MSINWDLVPFFQRSEFDDPNYPGSGDNINGNFLHMIIKLRKATTVVNYPDGWPMITHTSVGGVIDMDGSHGHSDRSYHRFDKGCMALDFHFKTNVSPRDQYHVVSTIGFGGLGVYYDWHWSGKLLKIGFHIDIRPKSRTQRWVRKNGKYIYLLT